MPYQAPGHISRPPECRLPERSGSYTAAADLPRAPLYHPAFTLGTPDHDLRRPGLAIIHAQMVTDA
jgi:hypothetical protein